jgi:hypothetical protein
MKKINFFMVLAYIVMFMLGWMIANLVKGCILNGY